MAQMAFTSKYVLVESSKYSDLLNRIDSLSSNQDNTTTSPVKQSIHDQAQPVNQIPPPRDPSPVKETSHDQVQIDHPRELAYDKIIECIPTRQRCKAASLLAYFKTIEELGWNDRGNIIINSTTIPNSHIVDLVKFCLNSKSAFTPAGWEQIAQVLYDASTPLSLISNIKARSDISQLQTGHGSDQSSVKPVLPPGIPQSHFNVEYSPEPVVKKSDKKTVKSKTRVKWLAVKN